MYWNRPRFWTYILTNWEHTVLYTGMTNHMPFRLIEHFLGLDDGFSKAYQTKYLVWHKETRYVLNAIALENEIKNLRRNGKIALIEEQNPLWHHQNEDILGNWPPTAAQIEDMFEYRRHEDLRIMKAMEIAKQRGRE